MNPTVGSAKVIIQGAGPVGLACAIWLLQKNPELPLVLLDKNPPDDASLSNTDTRGIAISEGSKQLLENMQAWVGDTPPIHYVHVSHRGHFGRTVMSKDEIGQSALGHIVRYNDILLSLRARLRVIAEHSRHFQWLHDFTEVINLSNCSSETCLIHADGGLFHEQSEKDIYKDYGQAALVGWLQTSGIKPNIAWERFTEEGPLAILPHHSGSDFKNFVWCASNEKIQILQNLSDEDFLKELVQTLQLPIGKFLGVQDRRSYPLGLNIRKKIVRGREVWIGNAAQTLHPVAGQGLNLGLRDAFSLSNSLGLVYAKTTSTPEDLIKGLNSYEQYRQSDRNITIGVTDLMASVFASNLFPLVIARGLALFSLQWFPAIKNKLARQMMFGQR
jgi:2-octaprenyl-6-methoxyphenol hydroxylase